MHVGAAEVWRGLAWGGWGGVWEGWFRDLGRAGVVGGARAQAQLGFRPFRPGLGGTGVGDGGGGVGAEARPDPEWPLATGFPGYRVPGPLVLVRGGYRGYGYPGSVFSIRKYGCMLLLFGVNIKCYESTCVCSNVLQC